MQNPRLAGRYAKSLVVLATEQNQLEVVCTDMKYLQSVCKLSHDFTNLLRSPVIKADKKEKIVKEVVGGKISALSAAFINLLIQKGRESFLLEVAESVIEQYNQIKGIHHVKLTTATAQGDAVKAAIINKIKADTALQQIELETQVNESLIGGFTLEFNGNLVDASIARHLKDLQQQFHGNVYVQDIR